MVTHPILYCALFLAAASLAAQSPSPDAVRAWVLWLDKASPAAEFNQRSHLSVLETFGYRPRAVRVAGFGKAPESNDVLVVVPAEAGVRLNEAQQRAILRYLAGGGRVVAEGRQAWVEKLGIRWRGRRLSVSRVTDVSSPSMPLLWRPEESVESFTPPRDARTLITDAASGQPLACSGTYNAGRYVYLSTPLDPHTPDGSSHYPYFPRYLIDTFGPPAGAGKPRIEAYFDPSYRVGADLDKLAAQWRDSGIRAVYAAAWIFYPQYQFNYGEFIRACHRNRVAVYAWFVFPATTPLMWEAHPEWREKTATGADGRIGWRYSMNLENPACFRAAMDWMRNMLRDYAWDGVNITELNFDADFNDWLQPARFVPFNDEARAGFRKGAGFDPILLFDTNAPHHYKKNPGALERFLRYREDVVTDWHRRVLSELEPLRRERGWEVIVTVLDSLHSRYVRPALGVDSARIAGLMKRFRFTLQVEDPAEHWMRPPGRYAEFARAYSRLVKDRRRLMFDVNVMNDRDVDRTFLPSPTATGVELAGTVAAAAAASAAGRVAIYSEHTVPTQDWPLLRIALGRP